MKVNSSPDVSQEKISSLILGLEFACTYLDDLFIISNGSVLKGDSSSATSSTSCHPERPKKSLRTQKINSIIWEVFISQSEKNLKITEFPWS